MAAHGGYEFAAHMTAMAHGADFVAADGGSAASTAI
jgi:hypothetical protein